MHPDDYQDDLRTERHDTARCVSCQQPATSDGLDDDGLCPGCAPEDERPVGEVPPYIGATRAQAERARLEHDRLRDAVLAWRAVDRVAAPGDPAWWAVVYPLRDIADRIAGVTP